MKRFPYYCQPEKLGFAHRARPEGRIHDMKLDEKLLYVCKYLFAKRFDAPPDELAHFDRQRDLIKNLRKETAPKGAVRLALTGDLMWIRDSWGTFLDDKTRDYLESFDAVVGNLETVVSQNIPVNEFWPDLFFFNSDPRLVTSFRHRNSGNSLFGALSFANNHTLDHGDAAALDTIRFLDEQGIPHSGVRENKNEKLWVEFTRGGIRFGFYAATFGFNDKGLETKTKLKINLLPGLLPEYAGLEPNSSEIRSVLQEMEQSGIDVKIISLHWGHEFEFYPSPKAMRFARDVAAAGADVILGGHPHVQQPDEVLFVNGFGREYFCPDSSRIQGAGRPRKVFVNYCSGNLASAMYTFFCRVAPIKGLSFFRTESGSVDWTAPEIRLFYNSRRDAKGKRKLEPIEQAFPVPNISIQKKLEFLSRHLGFS